MFTVLMVCAGPCGLFFLEEAVDRKLCIHNLAVLRLGTSILYMIYRNADEIIDA